jgi:hypothetical protein
MTADRKRQLRTLFENLAMYGGLAAFLVWFWGKVVRMMLEKLKRREKK